jgi:ribosomal-protein-alanine N-acetyltransferase
MTEADLDAVLAIDEASFDAPRPQREGHTGRELRAVQLREELARSFSRLRVAKASTGEVLGYMLFWHVADELQSLNVAVAPQERRRGVGGALVRDVIDYARRHAASRILLEVRASNDAARALYARLGFEPFHVRPRYYDDGEDAVEMSLEVALR